MIPLTPRRPRIGRNIPREHNTHGSNMSYIPSNKPRQTSLMNSSSVMSTDWRRYGMKRRQEILKQDDADGGNMFDLSHDLRIQGYFELCQKVTDRFNIAFASQSDHEATYIMGHRLIHFLSESLPQHPQYMSKDPTITQLREESFRSLVLIRKRIETLAFRIDEEHLNKYMMNEFDPLVADDDDSSTSSSSNDFYTDSLNKSFANDDGDDDGAWQPKPWENFAGWSFDLPEKMTSSTMHSRQKIIKDLQSSPKSLLDLDTTADTVDTSKDSFSSEDNSFHIRDEDFAPIYSSRGAAFLRQIASEDVLYEEDSEAADSWDQDEDEADESAVSTGVTYDPARIALRELLENKNRPSPQARDKLFGASIPFDEEADLGKENRSGPFFYVSQDSFDSLEERDIWIAFAPSDNERIAERVAL